MAIKAYNSFTLVDLNDGLIYKGEYASVAEIPGTPQQGWWYKNTTNGNAYVYDERDGWILLASDGEDGKSPYTYRIDSSNGFLINTSVTDITSVTLTARVFQDEKEIDASGTNSYEWYVKTDSNNNFVKISTSTKKLNYSLSNFNSSALFYFVLIKNEEKLQSNSVSITKVSNGESADAYSIQFNHEEILIFKSDTLDEKNLIFSPQSLEFNIYKNNDDALTLLSPDTTLTFNVPDSTDTGKCFIYFYDNSSGNFIDITSELLSVEIDTENGIKKALYVNNNKVILDIVVLYVSFFSVDTRSANMDKILSYLQQGNLTFRFGLSINNNVTLTKVYLVNCKNGVSSELFDFSINAGGLSAAIQNSKLEFSANGLKIFGAGFSIEDDSGTLFSYDENQKKLYMVGTGSFTGDIIANSGIFRGTVYATDGTFNGSIEANSGTIGGFSILEDRLVSKDNTSIVLNGETGEINAENIVLGKGAIISDYLKIGNAYIKNPNEYDNLFIESGAIKLYDNGQMYLGDIKIDGASSLIQGKNWSIKNDEAVFQRIVAQGGSIENVVFKTSTTQAAGGVMIFKPSFNILEEKGVEVVLDGTPFEIENTLKANDIVLLSGSEKKQVKIVSVTGNIVTLDNNSSGNSVLIKLASLSESNQLSDHLLIGINPNSPSTNKDWELFQSGITFSTPEYNDTDGFIYPSTPVLFLGDLSTIGKTGYGLYGENVFLKGTLSTQVGSIENATYAGINTISGVLSNSYGANDNSRIVFWAGAENDENSAIQKAPFQVTEKGNLFAQGGIFKGSIISDSIIQGADIYTMRLHGVIGESNESGELSIYDTSNGIVFRKNFNPNSKKGEEVLRLSTDGFSIPNNDGFLVKFLDLTNGKVNFSVNNIDSFGLVINSQSNKSIKVENGSIILGISNNEGIKEDFKILFNKIEAEQPQDEQSILSLFNGADEIINYNSKTSIMKFYKDLAIKGILQLGEKTFFKKNGDYYDLYVE